jgi:GTP-binding protein
MRLTLAIVGRPNVGKSTLFNRLVGRRVAIVDDKPGVTRDRREAEADLGLRQFTIIDTAGLEEGKRESLEARMWQQTEQAVGEADVILMLIDARAGITPADQYFADHLRRHGRNIILVANKCEGRAGETGFYEAYSLGMGDPVAVSAEHMEGMSDLYDRIDAMAELLSPSQVDLPVDDHDGNGPLKLAIVGRPNVGKSTLVNRLIGSDRMLTGPEPGITRDAISVRLEVDDGELQLVDTAGLRRKARVTDRLEKLSASDTLNAIRMAEVVAVVVDGTVGIEKQDLGIASMTVEEGRALLIVVNKWDLVADGQQELKRLRERLSDSLPQARGVEVVTLSALTGMRIDDLIPAVFLVNKVWNKRVITGPLNRWLSETIEHHPPPAVRRHRPKFRYVTQAKARPPTFVLFVSRPEAVGDTYLRYLENELRAAFNLPGTPIRLRLRKGKNPFAEKGSAGRGPRIVKSYINKRR